MSINYKNTSPDSYLGYPAYYRVVYVRGKIDLAVQLPSVIAGVYDRMVSSPLAVPVNHPQPTTQDLAAVLVLRVSDGSVQFSTVADLVAALDVAPLWGLLPNALQAVQLQSIEEIDYKAAYDQGATEAERLRAENDTSSKDPLTKVEDTIQLLVAVIIVALAVYVGWKVVEGIRA